MSIAILLEEIKRDEIVLPAIQRDFVWSAAKIEKLLDSVMRGYPIGIIFLWETYNDIQYRLFGKEIGEDARTRFFGNSAHKRLKLVLDGQQRLQALYTAFFGRHEGKRAYFDVLSGRDDENFTEVRYIFHFFADKEAETENAKARNSAEARYFLKAEELIAMGAWERQKLEREIDRQIPLSDEDRLRVSFNLSALRDAVFMDRNLLKVTTIDEYKPRESRDRKSESDILEAFVRINREATPLSRSDLFFSMLKLNWDESTTTLPEFVRAINRGNSFDLDADFIIRSLLAVSDLGVKFDVDLLRSRSNAERMKANFSKCCKAVAEALDIVQNLCGIRSGKLLKNSSNLIPLIYRLFHRAKSADSEAQKIAKAAYLLAFVNPFSRSGDSRVEKFINDVMKPARDGNFPLDELFNWIRTVSNEGEIDADFVGMNPALALHLVQLSAGGASSQNGHIEARHIFPPSELRKRGYEADGINRFGNLWIPADSVRGAKGSLSELFKSVPDSDLESALIDRKLLDYRHYDKFISRREAKIVKFIQDKISPDLTISENPRHCKSPKG